VVLPYPRAGHLRADLPVGTMLAVLVAFPARSLNELTAIFSSGVSLLRVCTPILVGCALVSALSLLSSEVLAPAANRHAREIERLRVRPGKVAAQFSGNRYWMRGERGILSAQVVNGPSRSVEGSKYIEMDPEFSPAAQDRVQEGPPPIRWRVGACGRKRTALRRNADGGGVFPPDVPVPGNDGRVHRGGTPPRGDDLRAALGYVEELRRKGYEARGNETDLHAKIAYPLLTSLSACWRSPSPCARPGRRQSGAASGSAPDGIRLLGRPLHVPLAGRKGILPALLARGFPGSSSPHRSRLFRGVGR